MVFLTLSDFGGTSRTAVYSPRLEPIEPLLEAAAEYVAVGWEGPDAFPLLLRLTETGRRLLVPACWQDSLPQAELLISSSISGGDLRQRFQQFAGRRCWLQLEPLCRAFPLPCPDGQGTPVSGIPQKEGFYSVTLGCQYVHTPEQVILFDTEATLEKKLLLAKECGFQGFLQLPDTSP